MNTENHRRTIAVAVASVIGGLSATAFALWIEYDRHALVTQYPPVAATEPTETELAPGPMYLPDPTPVGDVVIGPVSVFYPNLRRTHVATACTSGWRTLESGPVGRQVYVRCSGDRRPAPPEAAASRSSLERLPTPAQLAGPLTSIIDPAAEAKTARVAGRTLAADLDRRAENAS
jgi:hypothetical protein